MDLSIIQTNDLTPREEQLIYTAIERTMRLLPAIVTKLLVEKETNLKLKAKFFKDNPEFEKHKDLVSKIIEKHEGDNPGLSFGEILKNVTPLIKSSISIFSSVSNTDLNSIQKPSDLTFKGGDFGEI